MPEDTWVRVSEITVPPKRMRVANHIEDLAASIDKNGLLHAITLRRDGDSLILIAGKRRLEAVKLLKQGEVRARILDVDDTQALLIEIDENLQRAELTELQRADHIDERKKVWESLYPQTKTGGAPGAGRGKGKKRSSQCKTAESATLQDNEPNNVDPAPPSFVEATAKATQTPPRTVRKSAQIGAKICRKAKDLLAGTPLEDRKEDLLKVSNLDKDEQVEIAQVIHDGKANTFLRAKKLLEAERIEAEPQPLPSGPFRVRVVDPPWHYEKRADDASKRENTTYATMTIAEIKAMDVPIIAEDDSILWLWTTNSHLPEAFAVAKAWGFTYKTLLTWDKGRIGQGDWLRGQTEHCLLCVKGRPTVILRGESTLIREQRREHSTKPEAFYQLVESLCPGSKVELFARSGRAGWEQWGYEAPNAPIQMEMEAAS